MQRALQPGRRIAHALWLIALLCLLAAPGAGQQLSEEEVKAAFLFNFVKFVDWPPELIGAANEPISIGVFGDAATLSVLEQTMAGKLIHGRPVRVTKASAEGLCDRCLVLYMAAPAPKKLGGLLRRMESSGVLTVGAWEGFAEGGGVIGIWVEGSRIRFAINQGAARRSRLQVSSKLLSLAKVIADPGTGLP